MAYYLTHGISQFLLNDEKQMVQFLLAHPVYIFIHQKNDSNQTNKKEYKLYKFYDKEVTDYQSLLRL